MKNKGKYISNSQNVTRIGKSIDNQSCDSNLYSSTSCCFYVNFSFPIFCAFLILPSHWPFCQYPPSPLTTRNSSSAQFQSKVVNKKIVTRKVSNKVSTSDRFPLYTQFIQGLGEKGWGQLCGRHYGKLSCLLRQRDKLSSNSIPITIIVSLRHQ